jgi:cation diffusion facilitator family transporter
MRADARAATRAGGIAAAAGVAVLALKAFAAVHTQSLALLADAAESAVSAVGALVAAATLRAAARAGEERSSREHGLAEFLAAGIQGALVVLAAFVVAIEAMARFGQPPWVRELGIGFAASLVATGGHAVLARYLMRVGRRLHSPQLVADALHVRSDVAVSLAVFAGLTVAWVSGSWRIDALVAFGVAFHVLIAGLRAVRHSVGGLMEESLPAAELERIERRLREEGPPVVGFHALSTHRVGAQVAIDLHLVISRYALLHEARAICDRIEADLGNLYPGARVTIRLEPEGETSGAVAFAASSGARG